MTPLHERLRQPEFDRRRQTSAVELLLNEGLVDIARPFAPWRLPPSPSWTEDPYGDETWQLYYHSLGWLITLDFGAESPEDSHREYCEGRLRELLLSYISFLDAPKESLPKMVWFDHATAWRASALSYLYEKHYRHSLTSEQDTAYRACILQHATELGGYIDCGRWAANNHGLFHAEALWDISQVFSDFPQSTNWGNKAITAMRSVLSTMINFDEGVCREHSLYYHLFDAWLLSESASYMAAFDIEIVKNSIQVLSKMVEFYDRCAPGKRRLPAIGDTAFGRKHANAMLESIIKIAPLSPVSQYLQGNGKIGERPARLTSYPETGFYIFHDEGDKGPANANLAIVNHKGYVGAHGHQDGAGLTIDISGEPFIIDSGGPYGYGQRLRFGYFKASVAHNVVVFNRQANPYTTTVTSSVDSAVGSSVRLISKGLPDEISWQRTFVDVGAGTYLVLDGFRAPLSVRADVLFHFAPGTSSIQQSPHCWLINCGEVKARMLNYSNLQLDSTWSEGGSDFPAGFVTPELRVASAAPVLGIGSQARSGWMATLISTDTSIQMQVQSMYGDKLLRILLTTSGHTRAFDISMERPDQPVKGMVVRLYGGSE